MLRPNPIKTPKITAKYNAKAKNFFNFQLEKHLLVIVLFLERKVLTRNANPTCTIPQVINKKINTPGCKNRFKPQIAPNINTHTATTKYKNISKQKVKSQYKDIFIPIFSF